MAMKKLRMQPLLDRLTMAHRRDIQSLLDGGYLNPGEGNRVLREAVEKGTGAGGGGEGSVKFGRSGSEDGEVGGSEEDAGTDKEVKGSDGEGKERGKRKGRHRRFKSMPKKEHASPHKITDLPPPIEDATPHQPDLHTLLSGYDAVKLDALLQYPPPVPASTSPLPHAPHFPSSTTEKSTTQQIAQKWPFIPPAPLMLTQKERYETMKGVDEKIVERDFVWREGNLRKGDRVAVLYGVLEKELSELPNPTNAPDLRRLQVFSSLFETIIAEFRTLGPILSEIKAEYDKTIRAYAEQAGDLRALRTKVAKLVAQNENRMLVKYEKRRADELGRRLAEVREENERLRTDLRRKLAVYAGYLPPSLLEDQKQKGEVPPTTPSFDIGTNDPITLYERKIALLTSQLEEATNDAAAAREEMRKEFVRKDVVDRVEGALKVAEGQITTLKQTNAGLETDLKATQVELKKVEENLKGKEEQYRFLLKEYT
ncbi:hypothetical protein HDV00_012113 [Rhizophlyctis rosea]|nr:hypothetical protein HDV00_012113 [Rhizophlyctis rosea]